MNNKRINFFFIIFLFFFIPINAFCQNSTNWVSHISYGEDIQSIVQNGNIIYCLTDGKLFIYNQSDNSVDEFIKYEGGNSDITHIEYSTKNKYLFITRSDGNIEFLYENKSYDKIFAFRDYSSGQIADKTINSVYMNDDFAYLSTNFGFITINLAEKVIQETALFNSTFYSICSYNNNLYAATKEGILFVDSTKNAQDPANWEKLIVNEYYKDDDYKFEDSDIKNIVLFKDKLHFLVPDSAVYVMESTESVKGILKGSKPFAMYTTSNDRLMILNKDQYWEYTDLSTQNSVEISTLSYIIPNGSSTNEYWAAISGYNLSLIKTDGNSFENLKPWIVPQGPVSNSPFSLFYQDDQLIVTGGGFYTSPSEKPASLSILKDSKWSNIYPNTISQESGEYTKDFGFAVSDPSNPNHIFASSWGQGLYEFENGHFKNRYNNSNSTLEELVGENNYRRTRVGGMAYDKSGNLWMTNSMVKNVIKVLSKNGEWSQLYFSDIDGTTVNTNSKKIYIDRYSNKWVISFAEDVYLFILNSSNNNYKTIHKGGFIDQSNNSLDIWGIYDIAEESNGRIWLATDIGPFWIANSSDISSRNPIRFNKIKIATNSGTTGSVTGLLEDAPINAIAIDGADRKWIATQTSGVFLLSANNEEILTQFNMDNSPLPSNNIISLSIDSRNGYVYFGTERGLMAYNSGVTKGADSFSDVYVYPNPVRPDYTGIITVTGLKSNSHVKITDIKGNLIIEGKSLGGQFTWDGVNAKGKKIDTGVYLVFGSTEDGSEGVVTKIMVVR